MQICRYANDKEDVMDLNHMICLNKSHLMFERTVFKICNRTSTIANHFGGGYRSRTDDPLRARQVL